MSISFTSYAGGGGPPPQPERPEYLRAWTVMLKCDNKLKVTDVQVCNDESCKFLSHPSIKRGKHACAQAVSMVLEAENYYCNNYDTQMVQYLSPSTMTQAANSTTQRWSAACGPPHHEPCENGGNGECTPPP